MFKSKFLPVFTFLFIAVLASCNFSANKSGSIFLDFTSLKGSPSASRNLIDTYLEEEKDVYVDLTIDGLLDEPVTLNIMEQPYYERDEIPVGTKIQVTVEAYIITNDDDPENSKYILYKGTSNKKTIGGGPNTIKILMKELTKKIYVRYDEGFQNESSFIENALERETYQIEDENGNLVTIKNDGKTPSTGFVYIQSAIDWIAANGNQNNNYEIILTGYGEEASFNQSIFFGDPVTKDDNLSGKVKESITISSLNPDMPAINQDSTNITIGTTTPIIFTNIKIQSTSGSQATIQLGQNGNTLSPVVTLAYGTSLEGLSTEIRAVLLWRGSLTMQGNASINGYNNTAIDIDYGSVSMKDSSSITDCHATSGGAIYMTNLHNSFSLSNNAFISECSATSTSEGGGAIYMRGGTVYINGGSITSCSAYNGGAIYSNLVSNTTSIYLAGGEIKDNTADNNGSAIYSDNSNSGQVTNLHFSENAYVDPSNDIYLNSSINITLDNELTTDAETAALITLYSASEGSTIINCANSDTSILENCFSKFCVNPTMGVDTETNWYLDEEGVLKEVNYILEEADPVQIGDLVFADNTRVRPEKYPYLTYQMRTSLAGIVFYAGTEDDLLGELNLIVGTETYEDFFETNIRSSNTMYTMFDTDGYVTDFYIDNSFDVSKKIQISEADIKVNTKTIKDDNNNDIAIPISGNQLLSNEDTYYNATYDTSYRTSTKSAVDSIFEAIINETDSKYPLYQQIFCYGKKFSNDSIYYYDSEDVTNNWYIPTIAEYKLFSDALDNESFYNIYTKLCGPINANQYFSQTVLKSGGMYPTTIHLGEKYYPYYFTIDLIEKTIQCDYAYVYQYTFPTTSFGGEKNLSIPIHTYSLN